MSQPIKLWRCTSCRRVLLEKSEHYARERHEELTRSARNADFVREATWPAYLASLKRCQCGSRKRLQPVDAATRVGQLRLQLDGVVVP